MGTNSSLTDKTKNKFYLWDLNTNTQITVSSSLTLKDLKTQLQKTHPSKTQILLDWVTLDEQDQSTTLGKIVQAHSGKLPETKAKEDIFMAIDLFKEAQVLQLRKTRQKKLQDKLIHVGRVKSGKGSNYQKGGNGRIVFEDRHTAIFASAVSYALRNSDCNKDKLHNLLQAVENKDNVAKQASTITRLLAYLGLLQQKNPQLLTSQNLSEKLEVIKSSKEFSDFDPKFVYYIAEIYLKFMIKSGGKIYYIDYKDIGDFGIETIPTNSKIGIIGDFGTGLKDSIELLTNMILRHGVDVVFHLGDVYYAGTPQEYEIGVAQPLKNLRIQAKRQIRFYSIPGNHDYYSWGLPFLCFVKSINQKEFHQQKASYFCIRDASNKWQFLGMDTAYHDSNPLNQIYPFGVGPYVQEKQLLWHKHRLQNFTGSTILMTHHPLFSIHQRINGQLTKYRNFSCINPMLSAQMFENMSDISAWFWGHEHSLMFFKQKLFGLEKGRLLGNSSFHVMYDKESPYSRQKHFPHIPFIVDDQEYLDQYLPLNPNLVQEDYFGLSYAVIDMGKMCKETSNLRIQYWCSPSYSDEQHSQLATLTSQQKSKLYFHEYKLYEETIDSIESLRKHRNLVNNHSKVYLRCQIGLSLSVKGCDNLHVLKEMRKVQDELENQNEKQKPTQQQLLNKQLQSSKSKTLALNLSATAFQIEFIHEKDHSKDQNNSVQFILKQITHKKTDEQHLYLGVVNDKVQLIEVSDGQDLLKNNCIWICKALNAPKCNELKCFYLNYGQPVVIQNRRLKKSLTWQIVNDEAFPCLQIIQKATKEEENQSLDSLWMFEMNNLISENTHETK